MCCYFSVHSVSSLHPDLLHTVHRVSSAQAAQQPRLQTRLHGGARPGTIHQGQQSEVKG